MPVTEHEHFIFCDDKAMLFVTLFCDFFVNWISTTFVKHRQTRFSH